VIYFLSGGPCRSKAGKRQKCLLEEQGSGSSMHFLIYIFDQALGAPTTGYFFKQSAWNHKLNADYHPS
jgi:hypothetical protein